MTSKGPTIALCFLLLLSLNGILPDKEKDAKEVDDDKDFEDPAHSQRFK